MASATAAKADEMTLAERAERRIAWLTLLVGAAAAASIAVWVSLAAGLGVALGAALAWVNFRWLQQAVDALVRLSTATPGDARPRISAWVYVKFFGRYALIGVALYVIVSRSLVPVASLLGGLLALGAAAMLEAIYEVVTRNA